MSDVGVGKPIGSDQQRDAIHVAIAPVIAGERLAPGQHVGVIEGSTDTVRAGEKCLGIVDPFLTDCVEKDQRFFLFLYPNTVTGMRHHWEHPAFAAPEPNAREKSIAWLKDAAVQLGVDYGDLIYEGNALESDDYINNGEHIRDIWYDLQEEFWTHYKIVTGRDVPSERRGGFTCSC